jgi:hypothetical protein
MSKRFWLGIIIIVAFFAAGHIGLFIESFGDTPVAGSAAFGVSFVGIVGGILRFWSGLIS